jgi:hypothetical protein
MAARRKLVAAAIKKGRARLPNPWPHDMPYEVRATIASRVATRARKRLLGYPNVVSVGYGLEHAKDPAAHPSAPWRLIRRPHPEHADAESTVPCVHVVVRAKWPPGTKREGALPDFIATRVSWKGRVTIVRVPVAVVAERSTVLHSWELDASGDSHTIQGTATCVVKFGSNPGRYLLGCHHVVALSELDPLPPAGPISIAYQGTNAGHEAALPPQWNTMDAALALVAGVQQISFQLGGKTVRISKVLAADAPIPHDYYVLTRHGVRAAHLQGFPVSKSQSGYFGNGTTLTFTNVISSLGDTNSDIFQAGDSGSPLVTADGTLIGMHFSGLADNVSTESFALLASDVFGAFAEDLVLV